MKKIFILLDNIGTWDTIVSFFKMELTVDQALQKGIEAHKAGKVQEAARYYTAILESNPKHPDANHNMGALAVGVGKVEQALPFFKKALETNAGNAQFWLSYIDALIKLERLADAKAVLEQIKSKGAKGDGFDQLEKRLSSSQEAHAVESSNTQNPSKEQMQPLINLYTQGKHQEALDGASKLLKQFPNSVSLYNIIGAANQILGKPEEAIKAYNKALAIKPDYAEAYSNMGNALEEQGKLEEAIQAYNKALAIKPDYAEAYSNMGIALKGQGKLEEAIQAHNKALAIKPDYVEAHNNIGVVFQDQGKLEKAIEAYKKALLINPDYADALYNTGLALRGVIFNKPDKELQKTIVSLLDKKRYIRPTDVAETAISLLKLEPTLQNHLKVADSGVVENSLDVISKLNELPLLLKLMSICPLPDLELERLINNIRRSILSNISSPKEASSELIEFQTALALQCFINEYIYSHTEEEEKILQSLEANIKKALKNKEQPSPQSILALASYKALSQYDWCNLLVVNDDIKEIFTRQVEEPNQEEKLKNQIPILAEITDSISSEVRAQYEESPYPRWINLGLNLRPMSISNMINKSKLKLYHNKITEVDKPKILIAGCGTGRHSIETASRFKGSKVLAIDLSLSSLAYAKRKTDELAIKNIEYMQADILDLAKLDKQFDIIESVGVLHHMDNPMAGWEVLTDCLRPGGLMRIGLYSELARQSIVAIRDEIKQQDIGINDAAIKFYRNIMIESDKDYHTQVLSWSDFYSLSEFKDLLFHVQEHRFTIVKIKDHLDKLGLKFCGFETNKIVSHFMQTNKAKVDIYDLDKWQTYEQTNPRSFGGMYQFWCQKVG